jgi:Tetratricopeptide repeat
MKIMRRSDEEDPAVSPARTPRLCHRHTKTWFCPSPVQAPNSVGVAAGPRIGVADRMGRDRRAAPLTRWPRTGQSGAEGDGSVPHRLLPDQIRVLGADHPQVLTTRNNIAAWTGFRGNAPKALRLFRELLPEAIRMLGADHPSVLSIRNNIAVWPAQSGNAREALRLFQELLPDQIHVLGADHPDVQATRNRIAALGG